VKSLFVKHGFEVSLADVSYRYTPLIVCTDENRSYTMKVRAVRNRNYIFERKDKFQLRDDLYIAAAYFHNGEAPEIYLVPSMVWQTPNALFVGPDYIGKASSPEWGIRLSERTLSLLQPYRFETMVRTL
jgi:hypothetical protein